MQKSLAAAERLAKEGVSVEVIDPRTLAPLDVGTIVESVKKTGRLVLVDRAPRHASAAITIAGEIAEHALPIPEISRTVGYGRGHFPFQRTAGILCSAKRGQDRPGGQIRACQTRGDGLTDIPGNDRLFQ